MYKVTEKDLTGDLVGFPIEVVQKMVEEQVRQGNEANVRVFQEDRDSHTDEGGYSWGKSKEGYSFWYNVIDLENFNMFFQKYPKEEQEYHNIEFALQQFIGFASGIRGEGVIHLVESMGLSKKEWEEIKDDCVFDNGDLREELEGYFKDE